MEQPKGFANWTEFESKASCSAQPSQDAEESASMLSATDSLSSAIIVEKPTETEVWNRVKQPVKPSLTTMLRHMIENSLVTDFIVQVGKYRFRSHLLVLCTYSHFFDKYHMFEEVELPITQVSPASFIIVYKWMTEDRLVVETQRIVEVFKAALYLGVKDLTKQLTAYLSNSAVYRELRAFRMYEEATALDVDPIKQLMFSRISKFFLTLVATKEYVELSAVDVCLLLSQDSLGVNSELEIFYAAMHWINYDREEREGYTLSLLKCIRWNLMPVVFLITLSSAADAELVKLVTKTSEFTEMVVFNMSDTTIMVYNTFSDDCPTANRTLTPLPNEKNRTWIFDKLSKYHHQLSCERRHIFKFKQFLLYLRRLQKAGPEYYDTIKLVKRVKTCKCRLRHVNRFYGVLDD